MGKASYMQLYVMRHESHTEAKVIRIPSYLIWSSFRAFPSFSIVAIVQICSEMHARNKNDRSPTRILTEKPLAFQKGAKKIETQVTV